MNASRGTAYIVTVGLLAVGCSGGSSVPVAPTQIAFAEQPEAAKVVAQKPTPPGVAPKMPEAGPPLPPMAYEAKGRRDPFRPVDISKEKPSLEVSTVKLVGVISGRRLLALVETPNGLGYIVKPGDVLGNGHVTDVTPNSVTFAVTGSSSPRETSLTLKLTRD